MTSLIPSMIVLGLAALAALVLAVVRPSPSQNVKERAGAARVLAVAFGLQCIHFAEEATAGLPARFPALFGDPPVPMSFFVTVNGIWLVIWCASIPAIRSGYAGAFFAAWFLAFAGWINLVAHPLLSVLAGGYFPGLVTSPLVGGAGIWLWRSLRRATRQGGA